MTTRRQLFLAAGAVVALPAFAQPEKRVRRIGILSSGTAQTIADWLVAFRQGMAALRWVEGRDYVIDARYTDGIAQSLGGMAAELVATKPDLLLTGGDGTASELAQRTKTIPIVFTITQDPVRSMIVASLQRPGGNATGLTSLGGDLSAKRLQLLKEAFPRVTHAALLFDPNNVSGVLQAKEVQEAAPRMGMRITPYAVRQPADFEPAFKNAAALRAQAYLVTQSGVTNAQRQAIAAHTMRLKVPAIGPNAEFVEAGVLMSYSASFRDNFRRAAAYVDKIFKGAKPGDLPIEQPTEFELVVNLKTAKAMGLVIPQSILVRADRVIE